eukprot:205030-Ditylum_brightwellii.AAC.1
MHVNDVSDLPSLALGSSHPGNSLNGAGYSADSLQGFSAVFADSTVNSDQTGNKSAKASLSSLSNSASEGSNRFSMYHQKRSR